MKSITCKYCDNKWVQFINSTDKVYCRKCGDKDLIIKENEEKLDYYDGSPPFEDDVWSLGDIIKYL